MVWKRDESRYERPPSVHVIVAGGSTDASAGIPRTVMTRRNDAGGGSFT